MCVAGGRRCPGSHTPSSRSRAQRKAGRMYRKALADEVGRVTGSEELAQRVKTCSLTDLHEVALVAGVDADAVARSCGEASYVSPQGEEVHVEVRPTGDTRRAAMSESSRQLVGDVAAACAQSEELSPWQKAAVNGDRALLGEMEEKVGAAREECGELSRDLSGVDDAVLLERYEQAKKVAGEVEGFGPGSDRADMVRPFAEEVVRRELNPVAQPDNAHTESTTQPSGTELEDFKQRAADADDLTDFPLSAWPSDTEGKTLPDNATIASRAEFYLGLRTAGTDEEKALAHTTDTTRLAGFNEDGKAVYVREDGAMVALPPQAFESPHLEAFVDAEATVASLHPGKVMDADKSCLPDKDSTSLSELAGQFKYVQAASYALATTPAPEGHADRDLDILAARSRAAGDLLNMFSNGARPHYNHGKLTNNPNSFEGEQARALKIAADYEFARALDARAREDGTADELQMSYVEAFETHNRAAFFGQPAPEEDNDPLVDYVADNSYNCLMSEVRDLKKKTDGESEARTARSVIRRAERYGFSFDDDDETFGQANTYMDHLTATESTTDDRQYASGEVDTGYIDDAASSTYVLPADVTSFKSLRDERMRAAYIRSAVADDITKKVEDNVGMIRDDDTYPEVRGGVEASEEQKESLRHWLNDAGVVAKNTDDLRRSYAAAYAVTATSSQNENAVYGGFDGELESEEDREYCRRVAAFNQHLTALYDRAKTGDTEAQDELISAAALVASDRWANDDLYLTRQYVDPAQESLF